MLNRGTLYTYSGKIAYPNGAPSLFDMAVSLSREGRFAGHGLRWWPVALHIFVVCDMLPDAIKFDGLMHESGEVITGDVPKPAKTDAVETLEEELLQNQYNFFKVSMPNKEIRAAVKAMDKAAMAGEVYTVGTQALQEFHQRNPIAEEYISRYIEKYSYTDCLEAGGKVPIEFMRRFRIYRDLLPKTRLIGE